MKAGGLWAARFFPDTQKHRPAAYAGLCFRN